MNEPRNAQFRNPMGPEWDPSQINWRLLLLAFAGFLVVAALWSAAFSIKTHEEGLVLRFGKFDRVAKPGLNWKLPFPIEKVVLVPVLRRMKEEFGFQTTHAAERTEYSRANFTAQSLMLTGDLNVADVEWTTQYKIADPVKYAFRARNITESFRDINEAVMRKIIGDRSVNEVVTVGRNEIQEEVRLQLQELCSQYELGIRVEGVILQDVNPPEEVKPSFDEVNKAQQEREQTINLGLAKARTVIPKAEGEAKQLVQQAEGYATDRVNRARGDVSLFLEMLQAYKQAPEVMRTRLYLEMIREVYPKIKSKIFIDSEMESLLPLLNLKGGQ